MGATTKIRGCITGLALGLACRALAAASSEVLYPEAQFGGDGILSEPEVALEGPNGEVYVLDRGGHRVVEFDSWGAVVRSIGSQGSEIGQLLGPIGLDVDRDGNLIVADRGNSRIQVFSPRGEAIHVIKADAGVTDVLATGDREFLVSRSFTRGRALYYRISYDGVLLEEIGERLGSGHRLPTEVALNTYRGRAVGNTIWVAFANVARLRRLDLTTGDYDDFDFRAEEMRMVHESFHRDVLSYFGAAEVCDDWSYSSLVNDVIVASTDDTARFTTYIAEVTVFDHDVYVLCYGTLYRLDDEANVIASYALRNLHGGEAYSHRMTISPRGKLYTVDSHHEHIVRCYDTGGSGS
jgi:hypothetical protein